MVQCNPFEFLTIAMPDTQNETWRQQFQIEFKRRNKIIRFSSLIACHMSRALMCLWRHVYDRVVSRNKWAILIFFFDEGELVFTSKIRAQSVLRIYAYTFDI